MEARSHRDPETDAHEAVRVRYTKRAEADIVAIGIYTLNEWGPEQWEVYGALLEATCERILPEHHSFAPSVPEREGLFRWRCERHVIYFRRLRGSLQIVRILHEKMLPSKHL